MVKKKKPAIACEFERPKKRIKLSAARGCRRRRRAPSWKGAGWPPRPKGCTAPVGAVSVSESVPSGAVFTFEFVLERKENQQTNFCQFFLVNEFKLVINQCVCVCVCVCESVDFGLKF